MGRAWRAAAAAVLLGSAFAATAADITVSGAWMRPAPAGAEAARVYVDIASTAPVELVGASSPAAARVLLVRVHRIDDPTSEEVVPSMPVAAGKPTRLAYRGDHLRFVDVKQDLANGTPVTVTLVFRDAAGKETRATAGVSVRGMLMPGQMAPALRDAPPAPPAGSGPGTAAAPARM
ncbi:MAG: copper chaperone PCu(A)C [Burkholderiales bacterium]